MDFGTPEVVKERIPSTLEEHLSRECAAVTEAILAIDRRIEARIEQLGLSTEQVSDLRILGPLANLKEFCPEHRLVTVTAAAETLRLPTEQVLSKVQSLAEKGLLEDQVGVSEPRIVWTAKGKEAHAEIVEPRNVLWSL